MCYNKKGKLLSTSVNSYTKSHPLQAYFAKQVKQEEKIYLHAEIAAILKAKDSVIHSIRVERLTATDTFANSKPCKVCMKAIKAFGVQNIDYFDNEGYLHRIKGQS